MRFVSELIASGVALPYTAIAHAPTVTLPRLKALTTGSNPTFLDAILNIAERDTAAVLANVDSWVRQLAIGSEADAQTRPQRKIVFAGDDTWLRLFPSSWFQWSEGVTSFFVSDTKVVDSNVTRHLDSLLLGSPPTTAYPSSAPSDWDVLILHYLGLDHVGHSGGSQSHLMGPKQAEIDSVIKRICSDLQIRDREDGRKSLLVMVGDHGMTDMGNHGGSSEGEVSSVSLGASKFCLVFQLTSNSDSKALLLVAPSSQPHNYSPFELSGESPSRYKLHGVVGQIDLVPTMSLLLGLGIPKNSMGRLISSAIERWMPAALEDSARENVEQIKAVLEAASPGSVEELLCEAVSARTPICAPSIPLQTLEEMNSFLLRAQARLSTTFSDYKLPWMLVGLLLLGVAAVGFVLCSWTLLNNESNSLLWSVGAGGIVYLATFFSTSFIEEEHEFWYFSTTTLLILLAGLPSPISLRQRVTFALSAGAVRLMKSWPHNGQKDVPNHSISSALTSLPSLSLALTLATFALFAIKGYHILAQSASRNSRRTDTGTSVRLLFLRAIAFASLLVLLLLQILVAVASYASSVGGTLTSMVDLLAKLDIVGEVNIARVGYSVSAISWTLATFLKRMDKAVSKELDEFNVLTLSMVLVSLTRPSNVPLFVLLWIQYQSVSAVRGMSPLLFSTLVICLEHVGFFAFGGSNSLATVDLSQAYNGISTYDVRLVTLLTYVSNFAGPIFWSIAATHQLRPSTSAISSQQSTAARASHFLITSTFHTFTLLTLSLSATHFRQHLFTWTVFSPALLVKGIWSVFFHFGTDVFLGLVI